MEFIKLRANKKQTIYDVLIENNFSQNIIKKLRKKEGYILLNDKIAYTNAIVKDGDIIKVISNPESNSSVTPTYIPLDIVHEDENILIINKPSDLACIPTRSYPTHNLSSAVAYYMNSKDFVIRIINRLDKDTSGLVCVAKNHYTSNKLNKARKFRKKYLAVCEGKILHNIVINKKILTEKNKDGFKEQKRIISDDGKSAITYVRPIKIFNDKTLCEFELKHGRTHQIRLHMSYINHPLIGDTLYGNSSELISHTSLCCYKMCLNYFGKRLSIKAKLPKDILNLLN